MHLDTLNKLVNHYVKAKDTDYAILINGEWGSGKTFYIKQQLIPKIEKVVYSKSDKDTVFYTASYISLYGITDAEELKDKIMLQLNPGLKKIVTIGTSIFKKVIAEKLGFDIDKELDTAISLYNVPQNRVLIFDDLERLESKTLNEVLGFLNAYTEHDHNKVIIIAHEKVLMEKFAESQANYERVKEKLIRFTYQFNPDLESIFPDLIKSYAATPAYEDFLKRNKSLVCTTFYNGQHRNLRTLKFVLDIFQDVFVQINTDGDIVEEFREKILQTFLFSVCVYSIEYKKDQKTSKLELLKHVSDTATGISRLDLQKALSTDKQEEENTDPAALYIEKVVELYIKNRDIDYCYYEWVVPLVHSGIITAEYIKQEAIAFQNELEKEKINPAYQKLDRLETWLILEDSQLGSCIEDVLKEADNSAYPLSKYLHIFSLLEHIESILPGTIKIDDELVFRFHKGMLSANVGLNVETMRSGYNLNFSSRSEFSKKIKEYTYFLESTRFEKNERDLADSVMRAMAPYNDKRMEEFLASSLAQGQAFLQFIDPKQFYDAYIKLKNEEKNSLYYNVESLMAKYQNAKPAFRRELDFLNPFKTLLKESTETGIAKINITNLHQLIDSNVRFIEVNDA